MSAPVRAVFFDAGNTLIRMDDAAIAGALGRHGVAATAGDVQRAEWRARVRLDASLQPGASTEHPDTGHRYLVYILDELGVRDGATVAALDTWRRSYDPPRGLWTALEPEADAALALARASGLRTAVISNSNGTVADILGRLDLLRHLDFVIDSSEVGVEKPDPRIFQLALDRAGVGAHEAAYVGDLYSIDVLGARAAGLRAVLMDPGRCWPPRDCPTAITALHAVRLLLAS
ncbi:MAG TPA: HAD family hydrolase [Methylomirabilota bacterium]|nr:HAD family hydrolase [Methylomirabilota bacterium]